MQASNNNTTTGGQEADAQIAQAAGASVYDGGEIVVTGYRPSAYQPLNIPLPRKFGGGSNSGFGAVFGLNAHAVVSTGRVEYGKGGTSIGISKLVDPEYQDIRTLERLKQDNLKNGGNAGEIIKANAEIDRSIAYIREHAGVHTVTSDYASSLADAEISSLLSSSAGQQQVMASYNRVNAYAAADPSATARWEAQDERQRELDAYASGQARRAVYDLADASIAPLQFFTGSYRIAVNNEHTTENYLKAASPAIGAGIGYGARLASPLVSRFTTKFGIGSMNDAYHITRASQMEIRPQVKVNKLEGDAFEAEVINDLLPQMGRTVIRPQITVKSNGPSGLKVRLDAISQDEASVIWLSDMKASATAPFTPNQKVVYPEL